MDYFKNQYIPKGEQIMSKKGLNIHKRKDGRWEGRYRTGFYENGFIKYASVYGKSYMEAKNKLLDAIANSLPPEKHSKERTFSEILRLWLDNKCLHLKGATEHRYRTVIERHIEPELGALPVTAITSVKINSFLSRKMRTAKRGGKNMLSPAYIRAMAQIIQSAMQFAANEEYCKPLKTDIYKPHLEKKDLSILSREEQDCLEEYLSVHTDSISTGILISLYAGLRIGEVCALSWEDVDLNGKVIHIRHTVARVRKEDSERSSSTQLIIDVPKTPSSVRDIPIASALIPYLIELRRENPTGYLTSGKESFMSPRTYEYRFHHLLEESGVRQINYHALRHTFATRCVESGMDVKSLSEILGHANVGITLNTYVHSSMERKREQLELLHA